MLSRRLFFLDSVTTKAMKCRASAIISTGPFKVIWFSNVSMKLPKKNQVKGLKHENAKVALLVLLIILSIQPCPYIFLVV